MIPTRVQGATRVLGAPADWDQSKAGPVMGLPIVDAEIDGVQWMISVWEPTPAELDALSKGARIQLLIQGISHPVVGLGVSEIPKL